MQKNNAAIKIEEIPCSHSWLHVWNDSPAGWGLALSPLMKTAPWVNPQVASCILMNENFVYNIDKRRTMWTSPSQNVPQETLTCEISLERRVSRYLGRTCEERLRRKAREAPTAGGGVGCPALLHWCRLSRPWRAGGFGVGSGALLATGQRAIRHRVQRPFSTASRRGWTVRRISDGAGHPFPSTRAA